MPAMAARLRVASHSRAVPSRDADASRVASGDHATASARSACTPATVSWLPVSASQILIVPSAEAVAIRWSWCDQSALRIQSV